MIISSREEEWKRGGEEEESEERKGAGVERGVGRVGNGRPEKKKEEEREADAEEGSEGSSASKPISSGSRETCTVEVLARVDG